jgi:hypothetical protein
VGATKRKARVQGAYQLPAELVQRIKIEAARIGVYPAFIVEVGMTEWLKAKSKGVKHDVQ